MTLASYSLGSVIVCNTTCHRRTATWELKVGVAKESSITRGACHNLLAGNKDDLEGGEYTQQELRDQ